MPILLWELVFMILIAAGSFLSTRGMEDANMYGMLSLAIAGPLYLVFVYYQKRLTLARIAVHIILFGIVSFCAGAYKCPLDEMDLAIVPLLAMMVSSVVVIGFVIKVIQIVRDKRRRARGYGEITCASCGYLLKGLRDPRCPECGTPFDRKLLGSLSPK